MWLLTDPLATGTWGSLIAALRIRQVILAQLGSL